MRQAKSAILAAFVMLVACSQAPAEPPPARRASAAKSDPAIRGFVPDPSKSRMRLGTGVHVVQDGAIGPSFYRLIGAEGVLAVRAEFGVLIGVANAGAPSTLADPLTHDEAIHNRRVLDYFVDAGLPPEQIGEIGINAMMSATGSVSQEGSQVPHKLDGFLSIVKRRVDGIDVPDSYAWARFNIHDEVVEEQVFWPPLDAAAVSEAKQLAERLATAEGRASVRGMLPTELRGESEGEVRSNIRHSWITDSVLRSRGTIDVYASEMAPQRAVRSFGGDGVEIGLQERQASESSERLP